MARFHLSFYCTFVVCFLFVFGCFFFRSCFRLIRSNRCPLLSKVGSAESVDSRACLPANLMP